MEISLIKLYGDFRAYSEALDASGLDIDNIKKYANKLSEVLTFIDRIPQQKRTELEITQEILEEKASLCGRIIDGSYFIM